MIIRPATVTDAEGITHVHITSWQTTYRGLIPDSYLDQLSQNINARVERWQNILTNQTDGMINYVAENKPDGIIGFVSGGPQRRDTDSQYTAEIYAIYLLQHYQGQGIGRKLFLSVVQYLVNHSHKTMLVWVLKDNPAEKFYAAMGGYPVLEKQEEIAGVTATEIGYGWNDLSKILSQGESQQ